jgi:hypothetical protein
MERAQKMADHAIRDRFHGRWQHINLLTQLIIEENILNIKLRH